MNQEVKVEIHENVIEITLDRPPANAITSSVSRAIHAALKILQDDDSLQCGIITGGSGRIFCAGWDLKELAAMESNEAALADSLDCPGGFAGITEYWGLTNR